MLAIPGALLSVAGVALLPNAQVFKAGFPEDRFNPFPISPESIDVGQAVYMQTCAACHGESGRGDGPQAPGLPTQPADLAIHVPLHTDGDLFRIINDGIPGTAMPAHAGILTEEQMWHLVNFLRTFER
jgi:mono/diheme cytochrome c family protein